MTSAPARANLSIVRLTLTLLPGIGDDENTTVSPGMVWICRCVPLAILDKDAIDSACDTVQRIVKSCSGRRLICFALIKVILCVVMSINTCTYCIDVLNL